jgi:hypothetical protein
MSKGAALVNALMENSKRVQSYEFGSAATGANAQPTRKLSGSKMTKKEKTPGDARAHYTFAL